MVSEEELKNMSPEEIRKLQEENCIFCKIAKKEIPAKIIYEDELVCAFLDIQPKTMGHTIIVPKKHLVFFSQFPEEETRHIFKVIRDISQSMIKALQVGGTSIYMANGEAAGQFAPHAMIHVIPRRKDEDIPELHPVKENYPDDMLAKAQKALVSRIEEVMGVEMKSKVISDVEENKVQQDKEKAPADEQQNTVNDDRRQTDEKTKKEEDKDEVEDIDLDRISDLFK
ncbi:MAG: HIT family protein [Candidatus Woesearchaeota archaeon]